MTVPASPQVVPVTPEKPPSPVATTPADGEAPELVLGEDGEPLDPQPTPAPPAPPPPPPGPAEPAEMVVEPEVEEDAADEEDLNIEKEYELRLTACGKKGSTPQIWLSLMHVKTLAQGIIDEIPGLSKRATASLCCPQCILQKEREITQFPLKQVMKQEVVCERTGRTIDLSTVDLSEGCVMGLAGGMSLFVEPVPDEDGPPAFRRAHTHWAVTTKEKKYCANRLRMGRPLEDQISLFKLLGLESQEKADELKAQGEAAIQKEMVDYCDSFASIEALKASRDEFEWTDYDWSRYLSDKPSEEGLEEDEYQSKLKAYNKLIDQAKGHGFDKDRENKSLDSLCSQKMAEKAGLNRAHMLALRLYTSSVANTINAKLHDGCSPERKHPYPALVINLVEALQKLRTTQSDARQTALLRAKQLAETARKVKNDEDADDTDKAKAAKKAAEAAEASEALQCSVFWRGVSRLEFDEFSERSGFEVGFMSMSKERTTAASDSLVVFTAEQKLKAKRLAETEAEKLEEGIEDEQEEEIKTKVEPPVLLFRVVPTELTTPADLSFFAVFPKDNEWVFPPGVILEHRNGWKDYLGENEDGEKVECTIVELFPRLQRKDEGKKAKKADAEAGKKEDETPAAGVPPAA